jgi:hypothetical protein
VVVPSYHYMIDPAVALLALGVLVLLARWVFSPPAGERPVSRRRRRSRVDYGLLVPIATTRTAGDAEALTARLREDGIRCTVAEAEPGAGGWQLMVFRSDARRASTLVRG